MLLVNWRTSIPRSTPRRTRPLSTSRDAARGHRLLLAPRQPTKFAKMKSTSPDWGAACAAAAAARRERYGQGRVQRGLPEALWLTSTAQNCHEACEIEESGGGVVRSDAGRDEAPGGCGRCQNRQPAARWRALTRVLGCSARGGARRGRVPRPRARCGQSLHEEDIEGFEGLDEDVKPRVRELIEEHKVERERRFEKAPAPSKKASKKKASAPRRSKKASATAPPSPDTVSARKRRASDAIAPYRAAFWDFINSVTKKDKRRSEKKVPKRRLEPIVNESEKRALMHNFWQGACRTVMKFNALKEEGNQCVCEAIEEQELLIADPLH